MIDEKEMADARTMEEDMETANNMSGLNKQVVELEAEVKRLQKEIKVLSKYRDIVEKYDNALLADGDTDPRWSELYD